MKLFVLALLVLSVLCFERPYVGHKLLKVTIENVKDRDEFLQDFPTADVWTHDGVLTVGTENEVHLSAEDFTKISSVNRYQYSVLDSDIQQKVDAEHLFHFYFEMAAKQGLVKDDDYFKAYHKLSDLHAYESKLFAKYPTMMKKFVVGKSVQGKELIAYMIHAPNSAATKALYISGLTHAREWISPPVVQYTMNRILSTYNTDPKVKELLDKVSIYALSVVNVDGYEKTWAGSRMWRKNMRGGYGVDLNRNFKSGFGGPGSSGSKYSEVYRGTAAYSEPEVDSQIKFVKAHKEIKGVIDFHSYSQLILRPWGKTTKPSDKEEDFQKIGADIQAAIKGTHGEEYENIRASELYAAGGISTDDWYENSGIEVPFCIELRPTQSSGWGFQLPPQYIIPTVEENFNSVLVAMKAVADLKQ